MLSLLKILVGFSFFLSAHAFALSETISDTDRTYALRNGIVDINELEHQMSSQLEAEVKVTRFGRSPSLAARLRYPGVPAYSVAFTVGGDNEVSCYFDVSYEYQTARTVDCEGDVLVKQLGFQLRSLMFKDSYPLEKPAQHHPNADDLRFDKKALTSKPRPKEPKPFSQTAPSKNRNQYEK